MSLWQNAKAAWASILRPFKRHVRNDDRLAMLSNTGATIVWTHLPVYPLLVWWFAGRPVWPACILLVTAPLFFAAPALGRRYPMAARASFAAFGIFNTLIAVKAMGVQSEAGWFLLPCLLIAATFFRMREWKVSGVLSLATGACALAIRHLGPPLHAYTAAQYHQLAVLNYWCVGGLSAYLLFVAARAQLAMREQV